MSVRGRIIESLKKTAVGRQLMGERRSRMVLSAAGAFLVNFLYALYHGVLGIANRSLWLITIATYTFTKITLAVIRAVRQRKDPSPLLKVIRSIGYAEAAASVLTLQRSMVATFGKPGEFIVLDRINGAVVCFFVLGLGVNMMANGKEEK